MSDVREVTEWHEAMEGSLTVAGERLSDAMDELIEASGVPRLALRIAGFLSSVIERSRP